MPDIYLTTLPIGTRVIPLRKTAVDGMHPRYLSRPVRGDFFMDDGGGYVTYYFPKHIGEYIGFRVAYIDMPK